MPARFDRAPIVNREELPDGRLRVRATFSKVGPLIYADGVGNTHTEIVSPEELFRVDSLETAGLAPVTLGHPEVGMINPENWKDYAVGASGSTVLADRERGLVDVVFVVGDQSAIDAVKRGDAAEVSAGYHANIEDRNGQLYQTNRRYNHLALVPKGRAGPQVRVHMDSADWAMQTDKCAKKNMKKYKGYEIEDGLHKIITDMEEKLTAMTSKKDEAEGSAITQLQAKNDMLTARVDELTAERDTRLDAEQVAVLATARLDAFAAAEPYLKDVKFDASVEAIEWKRQAVAAARPTLKLDGKDDAYIHAAFDVLKELGVSNPGQRTKETLDAAAVGGDRSGSALKHTDSDWDAQMRADEEAINKTYEEAAK
ncbi:MAG: DUF2213 domain-containing protein [Cyanobacteria bacterium J06642_11]